MVWQADDEYDTNDHDDQFLAVDELPAEGIAEEAERELSDDIADICCCIYRATEKKWVGRGLLVLEASPVPAFRGDNQLLVLALQDQRISSFENYSGERTHMSILALPS